VPGAAAVQTLRKLTETPESARSYKENVEISFHGYDGTTQELFEIPDVRNYVHRLDDQFPFWLYFLNKKSSSLQGLLLCFLPPFLTDSTKQRILPERIDSLLTKRWIPALNHISAFAGIDPKEDQAITERTIQYTLKGPFGLQGVVG
jgi:hypothetical protein